MAMEWAIYQVTMEWKVIFLRKRIIKMKDANKMERLIKDLNNIDSNKSDDRKWLNYLREEFKNPSAKLENDLLCYTFDLNVKLARKKYYNACKFLCNHMKTNFKGTSEWEKEELDKLVSIYIERWGIRTLEIWHKELVPN